MLIHLGIENLEFLAQGKALYGNIKRNGARYIHNLSEALIKGLTFGLSITFSTICCSILPSSIKELLAPVPSRAFTCLLSMQMGITEENSLELSLLVFLLPSSHWYLGQVYFHATWPLLLQAWQKRRGQFS